MASTAPSPPNEPPLGGASLRWARDAADLSLAEAAQRTRIGAKYLQALEEDAPPETFPAPAYARFFLREYAEFLGLDPDPLLRARVARFAEAEHAGSDLERIPTPVARSPRRLATILVAAASVITMVVLGVSSIGAGDGPFPLSRPSPTQPPAASAEEGSGQEEAGVAEEEAPAPPARRGVHAVLRVVAPTWVEATADGETRLRETLPEGHRVVVRARRDLELVLGNAGGVRLRVNDRVVPTGDPGEVVSLSFGWRDGRVIRT